MASTTTTTATAAAADAAAARAKLAAALLGHDLSTDPLANPFLPIHASAVLQPVQHLLHAPDRIEEDVPGDSGVRIAAENEVPADGEAANTLFSEGGIEFHRRPSYSNPAAWSAAVSTNPSLSNLNLSTGEEERLADEWGLGEALSRAASVSPPDGPGEPELLRGTSERPHALASGAVSSDEREGAAATGHIEPGDHFEVLETRSEPALSRHVTTTFADEVLGNLEQRLHAAASRAALQRKVATTRDDGYISDGPRLKILERTPSQRRRERRPQSAATLPALPSLNNMAGHEFDGVWTSGDGGGGIATRDPLFRGAQATRRQSPTSGSMTSDGQRLARPSSSIDQYGVSTRPPTRLSTAFPREATRSAEGGPTSNTELSSSPTEARVPDPFRPKSVLSIYTSRFDPAVMAAQRAELVKDRPKFADPDAGKPPRVVLMPAPLAGQPLLPALPPRPDGPEPACDDATSSILQDDADEDEEVPPGLQEPKRPAGALYGRSLLDVMAERKALLKGQQRAYVPGSDGRRQMFDLHVPDAHQLSLDQSTPPPPASAEAAHPGDTGTGDDPPRRRPEAARLTLADRKAVQSIFGPDMLYQRELAMAKELEAIEQRERAAREELEALKRDEAEQRKVRNKLRKGGAKQRKSRTAQVEANGEPAAAVEAAAAAPTEWVGPLDLARAEASESEQPYVEQAHIDTAASPPPQRSIAPSLSVPGGLGHTGIPASASDWFRTEEERVEAVQAESSDEEDAADAYRPRPLSSLAPRDGRPSRLLVRTFSFGSDDTSTPAREREEHLQAGSPVRRLPSPGEPSSLGHDAPSIADTEDDRPLGHRFLHANDEIAATPADDADLSEDEEPLGKRFSRLSLPRIEAGSMLQLPIDDERERSGDHGIRLVDPTNALRSRFANTPTPEEGDDEDDDDEDDEDEDEKPLGARFSTILADDDEVPLGLHRFSLAAQAISAVPTATLRQVDDDGRSILTDSDEEPLGLRTAGAAPVGSYAFGHPHCGAFPPHMPPVSVYPGMPAYMNMATVPPPLPMFPVSAAPFFPCSNSAAPFPGHVPAHLGRPPSPPPPPPPPPPLQMQFAMAEMQMQAALHQSQHAAGGTFGPGASIDQWRKSVQP